MSAENVYKSKEDIDKEKELKKSKVKTKESKENPLKPKLFSSLSSKIDKEKSKKSLGAVFVLLSIYTFFSSVSYLFTWKADQDLVLNQGFINFLFSDNGIEVANWFGKSGAWISHLFIYEWFGVSSFLFSFLLFLLGFKWLLNITLFPVKKTIAFSIVSIVWLSIFLGFFSSVVNYLGGKFGFFINDWLKASFGIVGAFLFILALAYILLVVLINPDFKALFDKLRGITKDEDEYADQNVLKSENDIHIINTLKDEDIVEEQISETVNFDEDEEDEELEISEFEDDDDSDFEITMTNHNPSTSNEINSDDDEMEIEVAEEEPILSAEETDKHRQEYGEYDPTLDLSGYILPPIDLLKDFGSTQININKAELEQNKDKIVKTLQDYKIDISKIKATVGPTVTLYEIVPAAGVRISKIKNLEDDIALSLSALGIRIIAPIPGKGTVGIEVPNSKPEVVSMRSLIASEKFQNSDAELPIVVGKTITNEVFTFDLTKMPHLLVAGATGQGKSVGLNAILVSILYKKHPAQVKFVLVDPKKVELTLYNKIERHFLAKLPNEEEAIITDTSKVVNTLNSLCIEMDARYELLKIAQVRTIIEYNNKFINRKLNPEKGHRYLPYIVVLIDEFADLIMTAGKEVEHPIARIAQLARAIGIHLIVATQRPSVNVITGMIKANFPARIAFRVQSKIDSRTILDNSGADQLIGRGDMLISTGSDLKRLQCGFVDTPEVEAICEFIGDQRAYPEALLLPEYSSDSSGDDSEIDMDDIDPMFAEAARIVVINQQGSASLLQRKLKLGYNRAGRIVDQLEGFGIIGPFQGSKAREVLYSDEVALEELLKSKGIS